MPRVVRLLLALATVALMASCGRSTVSASSTSAPSATLNDGAVRLAWNPVSGQGVTGYRVYYGTASGAYQQPYGQGLASIATTYTVTGLPGSRRYFFAVTATNASGRESGYSNEAFLDIP